MINRILVLGLGQSNFLSYLYSNLVNKYPNNEVYIPNYNSISESVIFDKSFMAEGKIKDKLTLLSIFRSIFRLMLSADFYRILILILFVEFKLRKGLHFIYSSIKECAWFELNNSFKEFDTFHFHYLQYSYVRQVFYVPKGKKIVCSFWGSDLLRTHDVLNHYIVQKVLKRADIITCQTPEMREFILAKYGRFLENKIQCVLFALDGNVFDAIDRFSEEEEKLIDYKIKNNFSLEKLNLTIGHNANPLNQHLKIISGLSNCKDKSRFHLIVNFNYGIAKEQYELYSSSVLLALQDSGFSFSFLERFMDTDDLALYRLATDIFVHTPISDALSGTLTEHFYAGSRIITGSWLPYRTFRQVGLEYEVVDNIVMDLPHIINSINITDFGRSNTDQKKAIRNHFLGDRVINMWLEILTK